MRIYVLIFFTIFCVISIILSTGFQFLLASAQPETFENTWEQLIFDGEVHPIYSQEDALRRNLTAQEYIEILHGNAPGHAIGPDGWTHIVPLTNAADAENNTRLIYVDSNNGDDDTGEIYQVDGEGIYPPFIGDDPENPVDIDEIKAFATARAAYDASRGGPHLGDGKPDWILVKRGTTVSDWFGRQYGRWQRSGLDENNRFVITSYGNGARPIMDYKGMLFYIGGGGGSASKYENVIVKDLDMRLAMKDLTSPEFDLGFTIGGKTQWLLRVVNWRWENVMFNGRGFCNQHDGGNIHFRRCCWKNVYDVSGSGHTCSVFAHDGGTYESEEGGALIFDECVFTGGGWNRYLTEAMSCGTPKTDMYRESHFAELNNSDISAWQQITDGSFQFYQGYELSGGSWFNVTGVDFSSVSTFDDIASLIENETAEASGMPNKVHYTNFSTAAGMHHVFVFNVDGSASHLSGIRDIDGSIGTPIGNGDWLSKRKGDHGTDELAQIPTDNIHERNIYVRSHPYTLVRGVIDDSSNSDLQLGFGNMYRTFILRASHGGFSWGKDNNRAKINYNLFMYIRQPWAMSNRGWAWEYGDPGTGGEFIENIAAHKDVPDAGSRETWNLHRSSYGNAGDGDMEWRGNVAYNWGRGLVVGDFNGDPLGFTLERDVYHDTGFEEWTIRVYNDSDLTNMVFRNNTYYSKHVDPDEQFWIFNGTDTNTGDYDWWKTQVDDEGSNNNPAVFSDPERDVISYLDSIGEPGTIDDFIERALANEKGSWDERYTATEIINYIRDGFDKSEVPMGYPHEIIPGDAITAAPAVSDIPDQIINQDEEFEAILLDDYVTDADDTDEDIQWNIIGNEELQITIVDRIAVISVPNKEWFGQECITFIAIDSEGHTDSDDALFIVEQQEDDDSSGQGSSDGGKSTGGSAVSKDSKPAEKLVDDPKLIAHPGGPYYGFINQIIVFNGSVSTPKENITFYKWDLSDGRNDSGKIINHTFKEAGNYTITLTIIDLQGRSANDTTYANITFDIIEDNETEKSELKTHQINHQYLQGTIIDNDNDGIYDQFLNDKTGNTTKVVRTNDGSSYLIDQNGDGSWDYLYNAVLESIVIYQENNNDSSGQLAVYLPVALIGFFVSLGAILYRFRKRISDFL